jgi:hypothetical protein
VSDGVHIFILILPETGHDIFISNPELTAEVKAKAIPLQAWTGP